MERVLRGLGGAVLRRAYRIDVVGAHRVPRSGPVVLVANHVAAIDGPLGYIASPRPVSFLVKRSYFRGPVGWALHTTHQIPITQNFADREAMTAARAVLADGGVLGVFPEGTRGSGDVATARQGAAFFALAAKASIVPVALEGTGGNRTAPRPRAHIRVQFGEPFTLHDLPVLDGVTGRQRLALATEELRGRLAEHVRAAQV